MICEIPVLLGKKLNFMPTAQTGHTSQTDKLFLCY